jgi:hypothetical protein
MLKKEVKSRFFINFFSYLPRGTKKPPEGGFGADTPASLTQGNTTALL